MALTQINALVCCFLGLWVVVEVWTSYQLTHSVLHFAVSLSHSLSLSIVCSGFLAFQAYSGLLRKCGGADTWSVGPGPDVVSGAQLPSHSDVHHCCLTGRRIQVLSAGNSC